MGVKIVEEEGVVFGGSTRASHCNQWGLCDVAYLCEIACIHMVLWCGCSVSAAEWLDSSAVGIAHAAGESILCREGWRRDSSQITLGFFVYSSYFGGRLTTTESHGVFSRKDVPFGVTLMLFPFRGRISSKAKFWGVNSRRFQAKCSKYSNFRIIKTTTSVPTKFCTTTKTNK